jgi:hypothetical protein
MNKGSFIGKRFQDLETLQKFLQQILKILRKL